MTYTNKQCYITNLWAQQKRGTFLHVEVFIEVSVKELKEQLSAAMPKQSSQTSAVQPPDSQEEPAREYTVDVSDLLQSLKTHRHLPLSLSLSAERAHVDISRPSKAE